MTDVPERIWIDRGSKGGWMKRFEQMPDSEHEYIRKDLAQAMVAAAYADAAELLPEAWGASRLEMYTRTLADARAALESRDKRVKDEALREATYSDAALAEMGEPAPSLRETARLTDGQLVARCADAWEQAPVGSAWEHRKGGVYVVKGVALTSDDLTPVVVYQKTTGNGPAFTRPAAEFLDGRFRAIAEGKE